MLKSGLGKTLKRGPPKSMQKAHLDEAEYKGKGILSLGDKKKEKYEAQKKAKADLLAGKTPKLYIGGTSKSPSKNPSVAQDLDVKALAPPSSDPPKKRLADE